MRAARNAARHVASAGHRSAHRGRGLDFEESRRCGLGDDMRTIDWRVTARMGETYTKVYKEERERPVLVLADVGPSMAFGTRCAFKSVLAARLAALITWMAVEDDARVGGAVSGATRIRYAAPNLRSAGVMALFQALEALQCLPGENLRESALDAALQETANRTRVGDRLIVISDFHTLHDNGLRALAQCAGRAQTTAILIFDALEATLPVAADYQVTDGLGRWLIPGKDNRERKRYASQFDEHREKINWQFLSHNIELLSVSTQNAAVDTLTGVMQQWMHVP